MMLNKLTPKYDAELKKDFDEAIAFIQGKKKKLTRFTSEEYKVLRPEVVKELRAQLHLSQSGFARLVNASVSTVRAWEQGSRRPDGVASLVLGMLEEDPKLATTLAAKAHRWLDRELAATR